MRHRCVLAVSLHLFDLRGHPASIEDGRLCPVAAEVERECTVWRGHPVGLLGLAGRLRAEIQRERAVRVGLHRLAFRAERVAV